MPHHFEYDAEKLINEVKKRPGLWDPDDPDYRLRRLTRPQLWAEVVKEIVGDGAELSKSDMRELGLQIQKKWKGYRDTYIKYMNYPEKWKNAPYMHSQRLQFLESTIKFKRVTSREPYASSDSDDEQKGKVAWRLKPKKMKVANETNDTDEDEFEPMGDTETYEAPAITNVVSQPSGEEFVFANADSFRTDHDDPDRMFLLSLLPHLKAIPERSRLNVKMDMMQVLRNGQFNE